MRVQRCHFRVKMAIFAGNKKRLIVHLCCCSIQEKELLCSKMHGEKKKGKEQDPTWVLGDGTMIGKLQERPARIFVHALINREQKTRQQVALILCISLCKTAFTLELFNSHLPHRLDVFLWIKSAFGKYKWNCSLQHGRHWLLSLLPFSVVVALLKKN